ncbi:uncharacterized protein LOC129942342 [Eupeodes corollae]|uniref:uncharacterized protein LOC129942342 n=1 Tax=Eupeodes corollae TaxID=290404 RepID=UPI002491F824|nr:uncharacterized protein LOC129942342 [Eupeodes corollae]
MAVKTFMLFLSGFALFASISSFQFRHSISKFQDINMFNKNGILQCDQTKCPNGTTWCHIVKKNSEENPSKLKRENICYDGTNNVLKEKIWTEENNGKKIVDIKIDMFANGGSSIISKHSSSNSFENDNYDDYIDGNIISRGFDFAGNFIASIFRRVGSIFDFFDDFFF